MRRLAPVVLALLLAPLAGPPPAAEAGDGETLRWSLAPEDALLYTIGGDQADKVLDEGLATLSLFGSEVRDGYRYGPAAGKIRDLLLHYLFTLPRDPVEPGSMLEVSDLFTDFSSHHGPVAVTGKMKVSKKGAAYQIVGQYTFAPGDDKKRRRLQSGTLAVQTIFHAKKAVVVSGEFDLAFTESDLGNPPKLTETALKGTVELADKKTLGTAKFQGEVDAAVKKGVDKVLRPFLEKAPYRRYGSQALGHAALALYACMKAGVDPKDKGLAEGWNDLAKLPRNEVYSVALAILALESKSVKRVKEKGDGGGIGTRPRFKKGEVDDDDKAQMDELVRWLLEARQPGAGIWWYGRHADADPGSAFGDHSNTQFAVLALHAAARSGIEIEEAVWREIANHFIALQEGSGPTIVPEIAFDEGSPFSPPEPEDEGAGGAGGNGGTEERGKPETAEVGRPARGWHYHTSHVNAYAYGSMTSAGVSSLLIARHGLLEKGRGALPQDLAARLDRSILDGLAWLQKRFSVRQNFPDHGWLFYYLYSLEKATELGGVATLGGHDWWLEGAEELLLREKPTGGWSNGPIDTSFAILFLTRATAEPELEVRAAEQATGDALEGGAGKARPDDEDAVVIEGLGLVSAKQVLRSLELKDPERRTDRLAIAEKALAGLEDERRPTVLPQLAKLLSSGHADVRRFAEKAVKTFAEPGEPALKDEPEVLDLFARWDRATRAGLEGDPTPAAIGALRVALTEDKSLLVRRAAALALSRLRAIEAIPDLIGELEWDGGGARVGGGSATKDYRAYIHTVLVGTAGLDLGFDPAASAIVRAERIRAWRDWWDKVKADRLRQQEVRRLVQSLGRGGERLADARRRLLEIGKPAIRGLIDGLGDERARPEAAILLREITGEKDLGDDRAAWEEWWRKGTDEG